MSSLSHITLNFWSLLLLFGALQGFFFALTLVLSERGDKSANRLLSFLLVAISLHLSEYTIIATGLYRQIPYVLGTTLPFVFLIGPVYYLYAVALLSEGFAVDVKRALHFVPALLCYLLLLPFYAKSPDAKADFVSGLLQNGYVIFPLDQFLLLTLSTFQMLVYAYLTYDFLNSYEEKFKHESASTEILNLAWLKKIALGFSLYMMLFFIAYFQLFLLKSHRQEIFYAVVLMLSAFIHAVGFNAVRQPESLLRTRISPAPPKYQKTALPATRAQTYLEKLLALMASQKPFLNAELRLSDLAEALHILPNHLSQVINAELNKNFFDFVNDYRLEEAKQRLLDPGFEHYSILAIALEVGFNNKASFNRVFKKHVGMTPSDFVKASKLQKEQDRKSEHKASTSNYVIASKDLPLN